MQQTLENIEKKYLKAKTPEFQVGDTVRVEVLISEGNKERVQAFEGIVIAQANGGINETFTVRRIFQGVGIERTFLIHSPKVKSVKVIRKGRTRRAKLYYLRNLIGNKATRLREDIARIAKDRESVEAEKAAAKKEKAAAKKANEEKKAAAKKEEAAE